MDQERAMMIYLSYQKLRMPTFSVRQRRTENPLRERLLVRKFIAQLETYYYYQQQQQIQWQYYKDQETTKTSDQNTSMEIDQTVDNESSTNDDDEDEHVCSIVMSTDSEGNHSNDLMKNYALMLEVPSAITPAN